MGGNLHDPFFPKHQLPAALRSWCEVRHGTLGEAGSPHVPRCCRGTPGHLVTCGQQRPLLAHRNPQLWVQSCIVLLLLLLAAAVGSSEHQGDTDPAGEAQGSHEPGGTAGPLTSPLRAVWGDLAVHLLPVAVRVQQGLCVWDGH